MRRSLVLLAVMTLLFSSLSVGAGASEPEDSIDVAFDFTIAYDGTGTFDLTSEMGAFDCSGTFFDWFVAFPEFGDPGEFGGGYVILTDEYRTLECDRGTLVLEFDAEVQFPVPPPLGTCLQHSEVWWTVASGTDDFFGWDGSGAFDAYIQMGPTDGPCGVPTWTEAWTGTMIPWDCKKDGWTNLTDHEGTPFKNQGDCVSYFATDFRNLAAG